MRQIYEIWIEGKNAILVDEETKKVKKNSPEYRVISFEAFSIEEAMIKMREFLKIFWMK